MSNKNLFLKHGEIIFYYPISFETKKDVKEIIQEILNSNLCINDERAEEYIDCINEEIIKLKDTMDKSIVDAGLDKDKIKVKVIESKHNEYKSNTKKVKPIPRESFSPFISIDDKKINIELFDFCFQNYIFRQDFFYGRKTYEEKVYGQPFSHAYQMLQLLPLRVKLSNEQYSWLEAYIHIFNNKMGILKLVLPIYDLDVVNLKTSSFDNLISNIEDIWELKDYTIDEKKNIVEIANLYLSRISSSINIGIYNSGEKLTHIILTEFNEEIDNVQSLSRNVIQSLFEIDHAPVDISNFKLDEIRKYINTNKFTLNGSLSLVNPMGTCLSIVDKSFRRKLNDAVPEKFLNSIIASNIELSTEFAFIIVLLKKINEDRTFFMRKNLEDLNSISREYNENTIFILSLLTNCYGSVRDQLIHFEEKMTYYLSKEIIANKNQAMQEILELERRKKECKKDSFIKIVGFLISLFFGLPALNETIYIIRGLGIFPSNDVKGISVAGGSTLCWLLINFLVLIVLIVPILRDKCKKLKQCRRIMGRGK